MPKYVKVIGAERSKCLEEKRNPRNPRNSRNPSSQAAGSSSSPSQQQNLTHCCPTLCCCRNFDTCVLYCPCGSPRSVCRRRRLCGGPDPDPDTEALQPCKDYRCFHCFGFEDYLSDCDQYYSEDDFSEEEFSDDYLSEDSGFGDME